MDRSINDGKPLNLATVNSYNHVGEGTAHVYFEVTRDAAYSKISENCVAGIRDYRKILEMYQFAPGSPFE